MLEDLEMEYFKIFNEFPNIFNWVDIAEEDKIKILKKCIDEKIEVDDCDLYINNYLEHILYFFQIFIYNLQLLKIDFFNYFY